MLDAAGTVIYVGKAKNLKKRVSSYFSGTKDIKTTTMLGAVSNIDIIVTRSEIEAYLLENNLIKELNPKFNIVFRDDKSYPYIKLSSDKYPLLEFHRGRGKKGKHKFFGPYPSSRAVRATIDILQRTFKIRNCSNLNFSNRIRPCLQYQIKRCSAPCVGYISHQAYLQDIDAALKFINNKTKSLLKDLKHKMQGYSKCMEYENAARIRDQIANLELVQKQQIIFLPNLTIDLDAIAVVKGNGNHCVYVLYIRNGRIIGSKYFILSNEKKLFFDTNKILESFILQHYLKEDHLYKPPTEILISIELENISTFEKILYQSLSKKIKILTKPAGKKHKLLDMAYQNAKNILETKLDTAIDFKQWFLALRKKLNNNINDVVCLDVSHTQGVSTVAAIVFCNELGLQKDNYRIYNIKTAKKSDDYGAIREALLRYLKTKQQTPDLILIDGGKGQLKIAEQVVKEYGIDDNVKLLAIAKGEGRKRGLETIFVSSSGGSIEFAQNNLGFLLLQFIRDEAHRFAITKHRKKITKSSISSRLEDIPGIGPTRRRRLLQHFGGIQGLRQASIEEILGVHGINTELAEAIVLALANK